MCGIAGFHAFGEESPEAMDRCVRRMTDVLEKRGPDSEGFWVDPQQGIALGHRRLSIVELSPLGHQPMVSASGRSVIIYNGEIYNFTEIRAELEARGVRFRGRSDTEVLLEACEAFGIEKAVQRCIGMFTFALWDRHACTLYLVRDRLGIKPLYWGQGGNTFLFGSELKALRQHPDFAAEIDRDALAAYARYNYIPAPRSIYRGIRKLRPGCILSVRAGSEPVETPFWSMAEAVQRGRESRLTIGDKEATDELEALLRDAVGRRMVADVPLGAFLSGGVDSSTVVALMQAQSSRPVRTFSIGFHEDDYNEARHAAAVAAHLKTDHTELYVDSAQAREVIPLLPDMFDEPFADSSQIPTYLVSELTRRHVTVSLSGDGGDEVFAGYNRYTLARDLWRRVGWLRAPLRRAAAASIRAVSPAAWTRLFDIVPGSLRPPQAGDKLHKLAGVLGGGPDELYRTLVSHWDEPAVLVPGSREPDSPLSDPSVAALVPDQIERMQYLDTITYLPDDILTKVDRASMAVSLEARVPLLDHRIVEFAWRLPMRFKISNGETKWLLRRVLDRHVPRALVERPKMGFGVPIDSWLRGPLRDWAETLLGEARLRNEGFFNPAPIRQRWAEHLSGHRNWQYSIWTILMLQAWLERQRSG